FLGLSAPSLTTLVEHLLGQRLAKGDRLTDWTRRPLSAEQRQYAASDAAHLLELHRALVAELDRLGRLSWAEGECRIMLARPGRPRAQRRCPAAAAERSDRAPATSGRDLGRSLAGPAGDGAADRRSTARHPGRPARPASGWWRVPPGQRVAADAGGRAAAPAV